MNTKRQFLSNMLGECVAAIGELQGTPHYKLGDLEKLDDRQLGSLIPALITGVSFDKQGQLVYQNPEHTDGVHVFKLNSRQKYTLAQFDGVTPLAEIGRKVSRHYNLEYNEGYSVARGLFVMLGKHCICTPVNAP